METFGDRLRSEREDRGLSIQAVAEILRVDHDLLTALECNDFGALPDEALMLGCLHGYAECLDVDADLMIEDYVGERERWLRGLQRVEETGAERIAEPAATAVPDETVRRLRVSPWLAAVVVGAAALLAAWWMLSRNAGAPPTPEASEAAAAVEPEPRPSTKPADEAPAPTALTPAAPTPATPTPDTPAPVASPAAPSTPTIPAPSPTLRPPEAAP